MTQTGRWWSAFARRAMGAGTAVEALLLPRICVACEQLLQIGRESMTCDACWQRLSLLAHPRCPRCGHPGVDGSCRWCPLLPAFVRAARSVCWVPGGVGEQLVHALKYQGWPSLASELAVRMARLDWPSDVREEVVALVPVPLAPSRRRTRGFNQSERLAVSLGGELAECWRERKAPPVWDDVIERLRATPSQTRLTPAERLRNVAGAFRVVAGAPSKLRGAHVMLVDDVVTTAATLNECAATLWEGGARIISYVTFGRARAAGDAPPSPG